MLDAAYFRRLLDGYVRGTLTDAEREYVETWYEAYRELGDEAVFGDESTSIRIAGEMHGRLAKHWRPTRPRYRSVRWLSVAAAVLVAVGVSWWLWRGQTTDGHGPAEQEPVRYVEVVTGVRQVKKLQLPDSSTVWVSALSSLRVPERFDRGLRELFLDEGEAFFDVRPDPERPFVVHSKGIATRVLGTAFNVSAYARLGTIAVTVEHGMVRVSAPDDRLLADTLTAAMRLTYHPRTQDHRVAAAHGEAAAWREGVFPMEDATFDEVAAIVSRLHGVELKTTRPRIADQRYSFVVRATHRLEETLRILCSIHENQYRRVADEVIIY